MRAPLAHAAGHLGATAIVAALGVALLVAHRLAQGDRRRAALLAVAAGGLTFQVVHTLEHALQTWYWLGHTSAPPWLTPWAAVARDALAVDGSAATGTELLHLLGNGVFLMALFATTAVAAGRERRWLRTATIVQSLHVVEHVLITVTYLAFGRVVAVSSLFGALTPGTPVAGAYRVWLHFAINAGATSLAMVGCCNLVMAWQRSRRVVATA